MTTGAREQQRRSVAAAVLGMAAFVSIGLAGSTVPTKSAQKVEPCPAAAIASEPSPTAEPLASPAGGFGAWEVTLTGEATGTCLLDQVVSLGVGFAATRGQQVLLSADGRSWPQAGIPIPGSGTFYGLPVLALADDDLYVFGPRDGRMHGWRLEEDGTFAALRLPQVPREVGRTEQAVGATIMDGRIVLLGGARTRAHDGQCESPVCPDTSFVWTSPDGESWTLGEAVRPAGDHLRFGDGQLDMLERIWADGDRLFALGGRMRVLSSDDGQTWVPVGFLPAEIHDVVGIGRLEPGGPTVAAVNLVAEEGAGAGSRVAAVIASEDLRHWSTAFVAAWPDARARAGSVGAGLIAIGGDIAEAEPWLAISADGIAWSSPPGSEPVGESCLDGVAIGKDRIAVIGGGSCGVGPLAWVIDRPGGI